MSLIPANRQRQVILGAAATAGAIVRQNPQIIEAGINQVGQVISSGINNLASSFRTPTPRQPARRDPIMTRSRAQQGSRARKDLKRKFAGDEDDSLSNNSQSTEMADRGAGRDDEEVPVKPVPKRVSKILPDYFNIQFPCASIQYQVTHDLIIGTETITGGTAAKTYVVLNKLNNIVSGGSSGEGTPLANGRGISQFVNLYKYYRITQCDVRVSIMAETFYGQEADNADLMLIGFHLNDTSSVPNWSNFRDFLEMKEGGAKFYAPGGKDSPRNIGQLQFTYTPESWKTHVTEQGDSERWTPVGGTPPHAAYCHFGAVCADYFQQRAGANNWGLSHNYQVKFLIETVQHVQFREIKDSILNDQQ